MVEILISEIEETNRYRRDLGDIKSLANNIFEFGLLQPIVVKNGIAHRYKLIAGKRRLEAYKLLERSKIPATILNMENIIWGELYENIARKDFTMSEQVAILEDIETERLGHRASKERVANCTPFQIEHKNEKSRKIAAEFFKCSERDLSQKKFIVKAAQANPSKFALLVQKVDDGNRSSSPVYKEIKDEIWKDKQTAENKKAVSLFTSLAANKQVQLFEGDFRTKALQVLKPNSVPLIFTDPPYDKESVPLYESLGGIAEILLWLGGSLVTYIGEYALDNILDLVRSGGHGNLKFWWTFKVELKGPFPRFFDRQIKVQDKLLLWFVKGDRPINPSYPKDKESGKRNIVGDRIVSKKPDKRFHDFGQPPYDAEYVMKYLTKINDHVVDPFLGGGATGIACMNVQRRFVGIDINPNAIELAKANIRINSELQAQIKGK